MTKGTRRPARTTRPRARAARATRLVASSLLIGSVGLVGPAAAASASSQRVAARPVADPAAYVDPFFGTANQGNEFPGADVPFGMVQWSPDTTSRPDGGGYYYGDSSIIGFSLTHLSGTGCSAAGDIPVLPTVGKVDARESDSFSHAHEYATAGYYKVSLRNGVIARLTATTRTGMAEFDYPSTSKANLIFKLSDSQNGDFVTTFKVVSDTNGDYEVQGSVSSGGFCRAAIRYTVYFDMQFSQPFTRWGTYTPPRARTKRLAVSQGAVAPLPTMPASVPERPDHPVYHGQLPAGQATRERLRGPEDGYLTFDTSRKHPLVAKVGLSYVSAAGARANLAAENPNWNFAATQVAAGAAWNALLGKIRVSGGTIAQRKVFYTALYHALQYPNVVSDDSGQYRGMDGKVHTVDRGHSAFYTNISGWDIYRTQAQLEALVDPSAASDTAQSMLDDYQQTGQLPKWPVYNRESYVMAGDSADAVIADYYAFGGRDFDTKAVLAAMVRQATTSNRIRPGARYFGRLGYLPVNGRYGCCNYYGPVSTSLEYDTDDFAISAFAGALRDRSDQRKFADLAQGWRLLLNPQTGFVQPRYADGAFASGFTPASQTGFVEGDSWIYTGMVPFDLAGLTAAKGGRTAMAAYLNTVLSTFTGRHYLAWMGNEPSIELPWEYDYIGEPYQTQETVRQIQDQLWTPTPGGTGDGNDDLGTMSAWYVWSALGMYPMTPGTTDMALGSPMFPRAVITLPNGRTLTIVGKGAANRAPYVHLATWDGRRWYAARAPGTAVSRGGTLTFWLSGKPDKTWATEPSQAPPSYG
jgi:predicted alpha-1,2-mannosidase